MAKQTIQQVEKKLNNLVKRVSFEIDKIKVVAGNNIEADFKKRIFVKGMAKDGLIGKYSKNSYYVSIAGQKASTGSQISNGRLTPMGKNGKAKFKNGRTKKSRYLQSGYFEFRKLVGRQNKKVDLNLSGGLFSSIKAGTTKKGVQLGFTNSEASERAGNLEKKYNKSIFEVRRQEEEKIENLINERLNKIILDNL